MARLRREVMAWMPSALRDASDLGSLDVGALGPPEFDRDTVFPHRFDGARMKDLGAQCAQSLGSPIPDTSQQAGLGDESGIGGEEPGDVGPNLEAFGCQQAGNVGGGGVGSATAQQHGLARGRSGDKALGDDDLGLARQLGAERRVRHRRAGGGKEVLGRARCARVGG